MAIGQDNAFPWIERDIGLEFGEWDMPKVDKKTFMSTRPGVFFGGDAAWGPGEHHLGRRPRPSGRDLDRQALPAARTSQQRPGPGHTLVSPEDGHPRVVVLQRLRRAEPHRRSRTPTSTASLKNLKLEVELGFDHERAAKEVERCLNCDVQTVFAPKLCIECDACMDICPVDCINFIDNARRAAAARQPARARRQREPGHLCVRADAASQTGRIMAKDEDVCLHCGLCAERCPTGAWDMQKYFYVEAKAATACQQAPQCLSELRVSALRVLTPAGHGVSELRQPTRCRTDAVSDPKGLTPPRQAR